MVYAVKDGWVEINKVYVGPDAEHYYTLLPDSSRYQNVQIVKINRKSSQTEYITEGQKDVTSIVRILKSPADPSRTIIYYMSTGEGAPGQRHYRSVDLPTSRKVYEGYDGALPSAKHHTQQGRQAYWQKEASRPGSSQPGSSSSSSSPSFTSSSASSASSFNDRCYTCDHLELKQCLYNRVQLSSAASYYVHECLGPDIPYSTLRASADDAFARPWLNNEKLEASLATKLMPTVRTEVINTTDGYCK